jgi:hypothetical protein
VASLGDVDEDGVPDQLIGAPRADYVNRFVSGSAYIVYGHRANHPVDLATFTNGFRMDGPEEGASAGNAVVGPGDVTGDGHRDAVVAAWGSNTNGREWSGSTYVVNPGHQPTRNMSSAVVDPPNFSSGRAVSLAQAAVARGATIRYRLRRPARVTMRLYRRATGRRARRGTATARCAAPTHGNARRRRCTRYVASGQIVVDDHHAGAQHVRFSGVIGGRALSPGRYVLIAFARDRTGRINGPARAAFRIVK